MSAAPESRIERAFARLKAEGRAGLVTFITAGDPTAERSAAVLDALPGAGADIIEIGIPFSDPMADGPAIQASSQRALKAGMTLVKALDLVRGFRARHAETPVIAMGYLNPILAYGAGRFAADAAAAGLDGLILVDLPPEESAPIDAAMRPHGLSMIRLVAPTTGEARLGRILQGASGFVYYVSVAGVTGTKRPDPVAVAAAVAKVRAQSPVPVAVGFGIREPAQAAAFAKAADAVVVGSAIVEKAASGESVAEIAGFVASLAAALRA